MIPLPSHIGPGTFSPNEIDADALFARITERTADLVLHGPSLDDLSWFSLLMEGGDQ